MSFVDSLIKKHTMKFFNSLTVWSKKEGQKCPSIEDMNQLWYNDVAFPVSSSSSSSSNPKPLVVKKAEEEIVVPKKPTTTDTASNAQKEKVVVKAKVVNDEKPTAEVPKKTNVVSSASIKPKSLSESSKSVKRPTEEKEGEEENKKAAKSICSYVGTRGPHQGEVCGASFRSGNLYCSKHCAKTVKKESENDKEPSSVEKPEKASKKEVFVKPSIEIKFTDVVDEIDACLNDLEDGDDELVEEENNDDDDEENKVGSDYGGQDGDENEEVDEQDFLEKMGEFDEEE
jgi:hypothetical protein